MKRWICSAFFLCSLAQPVVAEPLSSPKSNLAIVIDDLGNNMKGTEEIDQASSQADRCHYALYAINERRCRTRTSIWA